MSVKSLAYIDKIKRKTCISLKRSTVVFLMTMALLKMTGPLVKKKKMERI